MKDGPGDLTGRAEIHDLVVGFYREVVFDDLLAPVFGEIAEVDWEVHIPKLIDYWCRVLLHEPGYQGSILGAHEHLHHLEPLRPELFDRWFELWVRTIDASWSGPGATAAKEHAARIGGVLSRRITSEAWAPARAATGLAGGDVLAGRKVS